MRLIVGLACLLAAPSAVRAEKADPLASIRFETSGNLIIFELAPDHLPALTLIFDTGSSNTVIDVSTARRLGLSFEDHPVASQGAGGRGESWLMDETLGFSVGETRIEAETVSVIDLADLSARVGRHLDGILGGDAMTQHIVRIDYAARRLELLPADAHLPKRDAIPIDFRFGIPIMKARIATRDGRLHEGRFFIDTGASRSAVIAEPFARRVGFPEPDAPAVALVSRGAHQSFPTQVTRVRRLELGPHRLEQPVVLLSGASAGILADPKTAGVIGGAALRRFTVTIDVRARVMHLEPNDAFDAPDDFDASGMQLQADGEALERVVVSGVLPDSPAEKHGIDRGDHVVGIDGSTVSAAKIEWLRQRLCEAGSEVTLELERAGSRIEVRLELRRLL